MHGIQVCVPDAVLLPAGIERVDPAGPNASPAGRVRYRAAERSRDGDTYVYDIEVRDGAGEIVERWTGLRLRAVGKGDGRGPWAAALLGPYLERAVDDLLGARVAVAVEPHGPDSSRNGAGRDGARHRADTALAVGRAAGRRVAIRYRPDGRPEADGLPAISASHGAGLTLGVVADATVACDVEPVAARPAADWAGLLGPHAPLAGVIAAATGETADTARTRVWAAIECQRKAGLSVDAPLTMDAAGPGPWVVLSAGPAGSVGSLTSSGGLRVATLATTLRDAPAPVVFAILVEGRSQA